MGRVREIVFTMREPGRDCLWIGRDADGGFFARIWDSGWKTIASGDSAVTLEDVESLIEKSEEEIKRYVEDAHSEIGASEIEDIWNTV